MSKSKLGFFSLLVALLVGVPTSYWLYQKEQTQLRSLPCSDCNIIFISVDSLRADHLGAYGYARNTSPNFDLMAKTGLLYKKHHSNAFLTPITEAIAHTGLYPQKNGVISFRNTIAPHVSTLAEIFKTHGFKTIAHGTSPEFKHWPALMKSFSRGFDTFDISPRFNKDSREWPWEKLVPIFKNKEKFFLWLSAGEVHAPFGYGVENKFADSNYQGIFSKLVFFGNFHHYFGGVLYDPFTRLQLQSSRTMAINSSTKKISSENKIDFKFPAKIKDQDRRYLLDLYDNGIAFFDENLARLNQLLKQNEIENRTIIVVHSEHGESLFEHEYIAHHDIWNEVIKTPLLISGIPVKNWKERRDFDSSLTQQITSTIDIAPTMYEIAHLSPEFSDGKSVLHDQRRDEVFLIRTPLWESVLETDITDRYQKFNRLDVNGQFKDYGLIVGKFKLIHRKSRFIEEQFSVWHDLTQQRFDIPEYQFFDLSKDPGEVNPLTNHGEIFESMKSKLLNFESYLKNHEVDSERIELLQEYK